MGAVGAAITIETSSDSALPADTLQRIRDYIARREYRFVTLPPLTGDNYPIDTFRGPGCCADLRALATPEIVPADLKHLTSALSTADFLLLNTGWSHRWGKATYFEQHPVLSAEAARWLTGFHLKAVGVDNISADRFDTDTFPIHNTLLNREILIIENLAHLNRLPESGFLLTCLPLNLTQADGAPVRVIAEIQTCAED